jgi:hypothetical protein
VGAIPGQKEAYTLTCEEPSGAVLETLSLVIDRGQTVSLDLGCGSARKTVAGGIAIGGDPNAPAGSTAPAVNGVQVPVGVVAPAQPAPKAKPKPQTRAQRLAACTTKAKRRTSARRRKAARASCTRRFGSGDVVPAAVGGRAASTAEPRRGRSGSATGR